MAGPAELCTLPTELQNLIVLNLHPSAAIALRQTNRWFHDNVSLHRLDREKVQLFLRDRELRPTNGKNYACFCCFRLKPEWAFTKSLVDSTHVRKPTYSYRRFCLECGIREGKYRWGISMEMAGSKSRPKVYCGVCTSVQENFCSKCHCCNACIASMGTWTGRAARWSQSGWQALCLDHFDNKLTFSKLILSDVLRRSQMRGV